MLRPGFPDLRLVPLLSIRHPVLRCPRGLVGLGSVLVSLLIDLLTPGAALFSSPARAAQLLEIQIDDLVIPLELDQLDAWSRLSGSAGQGPGPGAALGSAVAEAPAPERAVADQDVWLNLLEPRSRRSLVRLLRAPLLRDRSFGSQLLDSWAGAQMLDELGGILTTPDGQSSAALLHATLREQLRQRREVTALSLLQALPPPRLQLRIDALFSLAGQWRRQIEQQRLAFEALSRLGLPQHGSPPPMPLADPRRRPRRLELSVGHRSEPLPVDLWPATPPHGSHQPWLLVLPGLGGNADQLGWLAAALAQRGWSVAVPQHPGSDGTAMRAALEGRRPPPGAATLAARLQDVAAVLAAQKRGQLGLDGDGVVLVGHSLGALTALLAAGVPPQPGLAQRCHQAIARLPIGNPSRLLQCELVSTGLPTPLERSQDLRGLMLFNGFGSLLWPDGAIASLPVPVLMAGGSLDLVTPPLEEQLRLFLPAGNPRSRLVLVAGGSHFSPVRLAERGEALLQLGRELVGIEPAMAQNLLLALTRDFLQGLNRPVPLAAQLRLQSGVRAYVLDPATARRWRLSSPP